jgi:hypothetical protein
MDKHSHKSQVTGDKFYNSLRVRLSQCLIQEMFNWHVSVSGFLESSSLGCKNLKTLDLRLLTSDFRLSTNKNVI